MTNKVWISLTAREREILTDALAAYIGSAAAEANEAAALIRKVVRAKPENIMTVHLEGGFIEELRGYPIPVRIYDYDCDDIEAPDVDDDGRPCIISEYDPDRRRSI